MLRICAVVVGLAVLSGCAVNAPRLQTIAVSAGEAEIEGNYQRQLTLHQRFLDQHRLETIRFRVGYAAAEFCASRRQKEFGFAVANKHSFAPRRRRMASKGYGFRDRLRVLYVIKGSPAYNAGLRSGDYIVGVNGARIPTGPGAEAAYREAADPNSATQMTLTVEPLKPSGKTAAAGRLGLTGQSRRVVKLTAVTICRFDIEMTESNRVGAFAMGGGVTITKGMMWFARGDELAFVVAHELVHVIREHQRLIGRFGVRQKDVESEADYMGLYIMARAGYEIGTAAEFWRRIAAYFPGFGGSGRTHPSTSRRFVAMQKTMAEINAKIVAGTALVPGAVSAVAANPNN